MKLDQLYDQKFSVIEGDYIPVDKWEDLIIESYYDCGAGSFSHDGFVIIKSQDFEISIDFDLYVRGVVNYDPGDYLNPPFTSVDILEDDINIHDVYIDGDISDVGLDVKRFLSKIIKSVI